MHPPAARIAPIPCRPWTLNGLSERLVVSHYENEYGGAVRSLNAIRRDIAELDLATASGHLVRSLKQDELDAMGSVALHELYFGSLGGDGNKVAGAVAEALEENFGAVHAWRREFAALASALRGASGWVLLCWCHRERALSNVIASGHSMSRVDSTPLLAIDMYEHAYHMDFGANATAYVDAFMRNIDWQAVADRLNAASGAGAEPAVSDPLPSVSIEELAAERARSARVQVLDARPRHYYTRSTDMMSGAVWRDPTRVAEWSGQLAPDVPVYVYCAYGFHVGCGVTAELRERGFDARYVRGGLSAWYAGGGERTLTAAVPGATGP